MTSLCLKSDNQTTALSLAIVSFVFSTGFLSFDIILHKTVHLLFVLGFSIDVFVFSLVVLRWDNDWQRAGVISHSAAVGVFFFFGYVCMCCCDIETAMDVRCRLQIVWILGVVVMLGSYICT